MTTDVTSFFSDENWPENLLSYSRNYKYKESNKLEDLLLGNQLPIDIQEKIFLFILENNPDGELVSMFFGEACTDSDLLDRIAKEANHIDPYRIVFNVKTSSATLKHILTRWDGEPGVVGDILDHPNCTSEIAMLVASDEDYWSDYQALDALWTCRALTNEDVIKILDDWDNEVQEYDDISIDDLLNNPNLHEDTKKRILGYAAE
jgi:hypothetical protein